MNCRSTAISCVNVSIVVRSMRRQNLLRLLHLTSVDLRSSPTLVCTYIPSSYSGLPDGRFLYQSPRFCILCKDLERKNLIYIFYDNVVICCILLQFDISNFVVICKIFPIFVHCIKKNLATLLSFRAISTKEALKIHFSWAGEDEGWDIIKKPFQAKSLSVPGKVAKSAAHWPSPSFLFEKVLVQKAFFYLILLAHI
jgi:hypothetical protein